VILFNSTVIDSPLDYEQFKAQLKTHLFD